jgi:hypothetical protein
VAWRARLSRSPAQAAAIGSGGVTRSRHRLARTLAVILWVVVVPLAVEALARSESAPGPEPEHVYVTGDVHGHVGLSRLLAIMDLGRSDLLVVLGDFGLVWNGSAEEKRDVEKLAALPFRIAFVDGNHENFDLLARLPVVTVFGGKAGQVNGRLYHLRRGEIYDIGGHSIFVFGGGLSKDRALRTPGVDWWAAEAPSDQEKVLATANLSRRGWRVDFVLTHVPDMADQREISARFGVDPDFDETAAFLEQLKPSLTYGRWYCGHFHTDFQVNARDRIVATDVIKLF